jgi:hypothetical protein
LLMGASAAADVVVRGDDKTVDVMNNTVPADNRRDLWFKGSDLLKLEATSANLRAKIIEYRDAYYLTAKKHCEARGRVAGYEAIIGQNTKRYPCHTYPEYSFRELKEVHASCDGLWLSGEPTPWPRASDDEFTPIVEAHLRCHDHLPLGVCAELKKTFQGVQKPTCGFVRSLMAEHLANASQPIAPAANSNDLGFAKEKCKELGFAENTEKYGSCVLRLSR